MVHCTVICRDIVFAWNIKGLTNPCGLDELLSRIEFRWLGRMSNVACVEQKLGRSLQGVDLVERDLQRCSHILVGGFIKPNMAVADLNEAEA